MTSSLVGSEMCIRDSHREQRGGGDGKVGDSLGELVQEEESQMRACWAVSYTHLTLPTICSV
eukprot:12559690-Prorocentrum_lima.AAC.1